MGGNALQVESVRLPAARYGAVEGALRDTLRNCLPGRRIEAVVSYADKPSFGDLDILIEDDGSYDPLALAAALQATEVVRNSDVTSIGVQLPEGVFQVDLIRIPSAAFDFAMHYFGHNDLGNLMGRVAHKSGAKFGHLGLLLPVRDPDQGSHLLDEICITDDFATALGLLGYDAARYQAMSSGRQFRTLEDIFQFVVSTPYANRQIYLLDNRSRKARCRDAKRATYTAFLAWLEAQPDDALPAYPWAESGTPQRTAQKDAFLARAFASAPGFRQRYDAVLARAARVKQVKDKFNGELVARITGLSGKDLGQVIMRVRSGFADEAAFEAFVLGARDEAMKACILEAVAVP
jgi:hypothetical protein